MDDYNFPQVTQLAIPFFVTAILIELWLVRTGRAKGSFETRDTLASLMMGTGNVVAGLLLGVVSYWALLWLWQFRFFNLGLSIWVFVAAFLLDDLRYYVYHRIAHRVRWVWAEHVNHHSSQHYNLSTALRQSWTGLFTFMFVLQAPLVLLGFHPAVIAFVFGFNLVWQFWIHTETIGKMWGWFEFVFNTPSHHRVHHATNPRYLDANYAGTLIIWDRMFGTFVAELDEDRPRYGIVKNIGTFNPLKVAFHEWIGMFKDAMMPGLTLGQRLSYLIRPPGWSHDGSRDTSETLKAAYVRRNPSEAGKPGCRRRVPSRRSSYSAACACEGRPSHTRQSANARAVIARRLATVLSLPRRRLPSDFGASTGGNRPKLTFIGWKERLPGSSSETMWPPVIWLSSAPKAVVDGGSEAARPSRSAAAKRPASRPIAALST